GGRSRSMMTLNQEREPHASCDADSPQARPVSSLRGSSGRRVPSGGGFDGAIIGRNQSALKRPMAGRLPTGSAGPGPTRPRLQGQIPSPAAMPEPENRAPPASRPSGRGASGSPEP